MDRFLTFDFWAIRALWYGTSAKICPETDKEGHAMHQAVGMLGLLYRLYPEIK
jgi:hypothetical protein